MTADTTTLAPTDAEIADLWAVVVALLRPRLNPFGKRSASQRRALVNRMGAGQQLGKA